MTNASPATSHRIEWIEAMRGLAAVLVVLFHAQVVVGQNPVDGIMGRILSNGALGVDIFFVLSGFIITLVHQALQRARPGLPDRMEGHVARHGLLQVHLLAGDMQAVAPVRELAQEAAGDQPIPVEAMIRQQVGRMHDEDGGLPGGHGSAPH